MLFMCYVFHAFASVHCCLVVTRWDRADLLVLFVVFKGFNCSFVTLPCGILGQALHLIISIPDLCCLSYFYNLRLTRFPKMGMNSNLLSFILLFQLI